MSIEDQAEQAKQTLINLGAEARHLRENSAFKAVLISLESDSLDAADKLKVVDAEDFKLIRKLQNTIYRYEGLVSRLNELIESSDIAQSDDFSEDV